MLVNHSNVNIRDRLLHTRSNTFDMNSTYLDVEEETEQKFPVFSNRTIAYFRPIL